MIAWKGYGIVEVASTPQEDLRMGLNDFPDNNLVATVDEERKQDFDRLEGHDVDLSMNLTLSQALFPHFLY